MPCPRNTSASGGGRVVSQPRLLTCGQERERQGQRRRRWGRHRRRAFLATAEASFSHHSRKRFAVKCPVTASLCAFSLFLFFPLSPLPRRLPQPPPRFSNLVSLSACSLLGTPLVSVSAADDRA